jgi:hypothetical protein
MMFGIAMLLSVLVAVRGFAMAMFVDGLWLVLPQYQAAQQQANRDDDDNEGYLFFVHALLLQRRGIAE